MLNYLYCYIYSLKTMLHKNLIVTVLSITNNINDYPWITTLYFVHFEYTHNYMRVPMCILNYTHIFHQYVCPCNNTKHNFIYTSFK